MPTIDQIIAYEQGELSPNDSLEMFANLIKTGDVWKFQGSYGRVAKNLIDNGYISASGKILQTV